MQEAFAIPAIDTRSLPGPDDIHLAQLDNGIKVVARHNPHSPAVVMYGYIRCGGLWETRDMAGLSSMTGAGLKLGTERYTRDEIYENIEAIGGHLSIGSGKSRTPFYAKSLADDLGSMVGLLAEIIRRPTFPQSEYEQLKARHLTGLKLRDQDTFAMAMLAFYDLLYGDHPYGLNLDGYRQSVEELEVGHCRAFHAQHYHPQGMVIAVVGGIDPREAADLVATEFADWQPELTPPKSAVTDWRPPQHPKRRQIPFEDRSQCDIVMGVAGPGRDSQDFLPAYIGNFILGQYGLSGRLGQSLREHAGLAYAAQSWLVLSRGSPPWVVASGVAPENMNKAIDLVRAELEEFITNPVREEELVECQAHLIGSLPLTVESNEAVAEALVDLIYYGLGLDYFHRAPGLIAGVDRQQILETARGYIKLDSMVTVVAGPIPALEA